MDQSASQPPDEPPEDKRITRDLSTSRLSERAETTDELSARDYLILVVDDSEDSVILISLDLQQEGYRVVTANDGEQAVRVALQTNPDLILMDIEMPELDGLGAARKIRESEPLRSVPIIAVTALGTRGFQQAARDAGFDAFLKKPINFDRLHKLLRRLLPVK